MMKNQEEMMNIKQKNPVKIDWVFLFTKSRFT